MAFHRLTTPTYSGGLRGGDDYINNAVSGTPAAADNALGAGTNVGSYFLGTNEQITTAAINRGLKALANNCDVLDDAAGKTYAIPARQVLTGDGSTTSWAITGPMFMGLSGTTGVPGIDGFESFIVVTDQYNNPLIATNGTRCIVTGLSATVGTGGFSSGNVTATIAPAIPNGATAHVHYLKGATLYSGVSGMFSTLMKFRKGPNKEAYRSLGNSGTLNDTDEIVFLNPASSFNFTLATPNVFAGRTITFIDSAGNLGTKKVTLVRAGSETINNVAADYVLDVKYGRWELYSDGTNWHISQIHSQYNVDPATCGLRLTSVTGVPVPTAVGTYSTLYFTPMYSGSIALWDSAAGIWRMRTTTEVSLAISGLTTGKNYDVFAYWDSTNGVVKIELGPAWTNDTTRATGLTLQDGVRVKSGDVTRKYVGSIRAASATTYTNTLADRHLYNFYNQRALPVSPPLDNGAYSYTTANFRYAHNLSTNQVSVLIGVDELATKVNLEAHMTSLNAAIDGVVIPCIGVDTTSTNNARIKVYARQQVANNGSTLASCYYKDSPGVGYHYFAFLEYAVGGGGTVVVDNSTPLLQQAGMIGDVVM